VQLSDEEMSALSQVMARLDRQLRASEGFLDLVVRPPVAGSAIHTAYAAKSRVEFDFAYLFVKAGEDHLRTVMWVAAGERLPSFALYTLARGAGAGVVPDRRPDRERPAESRT
jgi:hypothetical protein